MPIDRAIVLTWFSQNIPVSVFKWLWMDSFIIHSQYWIFGARKIPAILKNKCLINFFIDSLHIHWNTKISYHFRPKKPWNKEWQRSYVKSVICKTEVKLSSQRQPVMILAWLPAQSLFLSCSPHLRKSLPSQRQGSCTALSSRYKIWLNNGWNTWRDCRNVKQLYRWEGENAADVWDP